MRSARDSRPSPEWAETALAGSGSEATRARAEGIAQHLSPSTHIQTVTAWSVGEESARAKPPLKKFGSASVERFERPRPVRVKPVLPKELAE
jgi:hypothetical protein